MVEMNSTRTVLMTDVYGLSASLKGPSDQIKNLSINFYTIKRHIKYKDNTILTVKG